MSLSENIIKSLDKDELRYIRKDILQDKDSQPQQLFELIEKYGDEDEKIAARFKRAAPKGNLAVVRNQLQSLLLKGIAQMHTEEYAFAEVNAMFLQIQVFVDRSKFDIVKKLLDKALEMARHHELFSQWIELLELKLHLYQTKNYIEDDKSDDLMMEHQLTFEKYKNYTQYKRLEFQQMQLTNSNYQLRTEDAKIKWENLSQHELLSSIDMAISQKAKVEYWIVRAQCHLIFYQYEDARDCFWSLIKLIEENDFLKKMRSMNYLWAYSQLVHIGYFQKDTALMYTALEGIRVAKKYTDLERIAAFTYYTNYGMAYYDLINDTKALYSLLDEAHAGLRTWIAKIKPDARMALMISCISVWVEGGEYNRALDMIHEFSEYIYTENRLDGKIVLLFYELIAQIESGNELLVNDTLQNFNRYLLRHKFKSEFEQLMIRFLKIITSYTIHLKEELSTLKDQLIALPERSILDQQPVLHHILMTMIDSRLSGKKYHDYMTSAKK